MEVQQGSDAITAALRPCPRPRTGAVGGTDDIEMVAGPSPATEKGIEGDVEMTDVRERRELKGAKGDRETETETDEGNIDNENGGMAGLGGEIIETTKEKAKAKAKAKKEKGKGTGKGKGKGKAVVDTTRRLEDVERDAKEDSDVEEYHAPTAEIDMMDGICGRALFTYARIDILNPPLDVLFGKWNKRPEVESKAQELAKSIVEQKFRPFASDSLLPLIIEKSAVEPNSIHTQPNIEDAPMLHLTERTLRSGNSLQFAGGRHRRRAAQIVKEASQGKVKRFLEDLEELKKKIAKAKEGSVTKESLQRKVRMREAQISMEKEVQEKIVIWGVAVYDQDEMLGNGEAGARHLSSNEEVHHYVAGPAERLDKLVGDYQMHKDLGDGKYGPWLAQLTKASSKNGQVFNHRETVQYLERLRMYRPHYNVDSIFSIPFCLKHLHGTYGGILISTVEYGVSVLEGLFSETGLDISEARKLEEYAGDVSKEDELTVEKRWKNTVVRSWNGLTQSVASRDREEVEIEVEMLTTQLQDLDEIFVTHFAKRGTFFMTSSSSWTSVMPMYVNALGKYSDTMAQQAIGPPMLMKIRDRLPDKMNWVMMDHHNLHIAPPFPLMTKSAVSAVVASLQDIELAVYEYCTWFDWSAAYNISRPVKSTAKDLSAWVIRTILDNKQKRWENPKAVVNLFVFCIWKNLDLFIAMQQYLASIKTINRPAFKDVTETKCGDQYPLAFDTETTDTFNAMGKVKSPTSGVLTTGLWPLDYESTYDWRHSSHKTSIWTQWIYMARIEKIIVDSYRSKMLRKCPPAAAIRDTLASLLSPLCTPTIVTIPKPTTADIAQNSQFYWPDNIKVQPRPAPAKMPKAKAASGTSEVQVGEAKAAGKVVIDLDIDDLRRDQIRKQETDAMISDVTMIFKKLHSTNAGLAIRGRAGFFGPIVKKLDELEAEFLHNIIRSEFIQETLDDDPTSLIDPYDKNDWPIHNDEMLEPLKLAKRATVYKVVAPPPSKPRQAVTTTLQPIERGSSGKHKATDSKAVAKNKGRSRSEKKVEAKRMIDEKEEDADGDEEEDNNDEHEGQQHQQHSKAVAKNKGRSRSEKKVEAKRMIDEKEEDADGDEEEDNNDEHEGQQHQQLHAGGDDGRAPIQPPTELPTIVVQRQVAHPHLQPAPGPSTDPTSLRPAPLVVEHTTVSPPQASGSRKSTVVPPSLGLKPRAGSLPMGENTDRVRKSNRLKMRGGSEAPRDRYGALEIPHLAMAPPPSTRAEPHAGSVTLAQVHDAPRRSKVLDPRANSTLPPIEDDSDLDMQGVDHPSTPADLASLPDLSLQSTSPPAGNNLDSEDVDMLQVMQAVTQQSQSRPNPPRASKRSQAAANISPHALEKKKSRLTPDASSPSSEEEIGTLPLHPRAKQK